MPRIIDYLESAAADNTGTSQMDRLLAEDEISNMHTEGSLWADEPYDPARSIAEGDFMPMGAGIKLYRGVPKWFRGEMVKKGKHVSPKWYNKIRGKGTWASPSKKFTERYALGWNMPLLLRKEMELGGKGVVLEFDVPHKFWKKRHEEEVGVKKLKNQVRYNGLKVVYLKNI